MRQALRRCWVLTAALVALAVTMGSGAGAQGTVIETEITSPSLEGNLLGDPATRGISVYLPPSYETSPDRKYPTVYLLNGFMSNHTQYTWSANAFFLAAGIDLGIDLKAIADGLVATGSIGEMIVVMPNGSNRYGGSWYERSPVIGDYRDYIARDVVSFVEANYRVQTGVASRAIAGHSMGGYGALSLAMEYPDVYSAVVALSPALGDMTISPTYLEAFLVENPDSLRYPIPLDLTLDTESAMGLAGLIMGTSFNTNLLYAVAAAFTPNPDKSPLFVDFPVKADLTVIEDVWARMVARDLSHQVVERGANLVGKPIYIDKGVGPPLVMPEVSGVEGLLAALDGAGVEYTYQEFEGDHLTHLAYQLASTLQFLSPHLTGVSSAVETTTWAQVKASHAP